MQKFLKIMIRLYFLGIVFEHCVMFAKMQKKYIIVIRHHGIYLIFVKDILRNIHDLLDILLVKFLIILPMHIYKISQNLILFLRIQSMFKRD